MNFQVPEGYITMAEAKQHSRLGDSVLRKLLREEAFDAFEADGEWYIEADSFQGYLVAMGGAANPEPMANRPGPDNRPDPKPPPRA